MALDPTALFNLSYGMYVLTAREDGRDCGCIVNTVTQLTENPTRIALSVNKQNFTNEVIQRTGVFNISVLTRRPDGPVSVTSASRAAETWTNSPAGPTRRAENGPALH